MEIIVAVVFFFVVGFVSGDGHKDNKVHDSCTEQHTVIANGKIFDCKLHKHR